MCETCHVYGSVCRGQRRVLSPLEPGLQLAMHCLMCVLGTELVSSPRPPCTLILRHLSKIGYILYTIISICLII